MKEVSCVDIRRAAMNLLARREYSRQELLTRLVQRFGSWKTLADTMHESVKLGDKEFEDEGLEDEKIERQKLEIKKRIAQALTRLETEGLQSDARLAEAFIRARTNKGQGPVKIRAELKGKGVATAVIDAAFNDSRINWRELAATVTLKKFGREFGEQGPIQLQDKARVDRFLRQRGFIPGDL